MSISQEQEVIGSVGPVYALSRVNGTLGEIERLNDMHEAIKFCLGGALSMAPLTPESTAPTTILEMGCGSGSWAIQAAQTFPDADVLAVDMSPLPPRILPSNVRFQFLDVTKPLPFEPETFDIVHARFLFVHLPNFEEVLSRTIQLVKPGGWLLLDDLENIFQDDAGLGPGQKAFWKHWNGYQVGKGMNPLVGATFEGILESSGLFSEVNVRKVIAPISNWEDPNIDPGVRAVGESFRRSFSRSVKSLAENPELLHLTPEIIKAAEDEMKDPSRNMHMDLYLTWSRKRE